MHAIGDTEPQQAIRKKQIHVLGLLMLPSGAPLGFIFSTLQIFLRGAGVDLKTIGFVSSASVLWVVKFLWSPLLDRYALRWPGRRRSWIVLSQLALAGGVNAILRPEVTVAFCKARLLSTDGRCKTSDAAADALASTMAHAYREISYAYFLMVGGTRVPLDVLVYATGFDPHAYMRPMNVTGLNGVTIDEAWKEKILSYGGIALPGAMRISEPM